MKTPATAVSAADVSVGLRSRYSAWADLFKARLTSLVLLTTAVGFYLGSREPLNVLLMVHTLLGTALLAAGAAALNQYLEREYDARMPRTANRPLPTGEITPGAALAVGAVMSVVGMCQLTFAVNPLTGILGVITLATYLFVYTPLKRVTTLNTLVGAVPGALPPLMGWTAAAGTLSLGGWTLFTLLFFWQLPHFMAIAWLYREDYARGGFRMLSVVDPGGRRTGMTAVRHTLALLGFSLTPYLAGIAGLGYLWCALVLGIGFLVCAVRFAMRLQGRDARLLFFASILYLPLILGILVVDKTRHLTYSGGDFEKGAVVRTIPLDAGGRSGQPEALVGSTSI